MWQECWFNADCSSGHSSRRFRVWLNQTYAITFHPMLLTCDSSKRACLFPAFVLTDIVMTIIGCVTPCLISAAKVEITWQVVCVTERPLQRCGALRRPITDADRRVILSSCRQETINSKNKTHLKEHLGGSSSSDLSSMTCQFSFLDALFLTLALSH